MRAYRGPATVDREGVSIHVSVDLWQRDETWGGSVEQETAHELLTGDRVRVTLPTGESAEAVVSTVPTACIAYLVAASS
jgi:hypothetical protein